MIFRISLLYLLSNCFLKISFADDLEREPGFIECTISTDDNITQIEVGQTWNSEDDPCVKYSCVLNQSGDPYIETITEECSKPCRRGYERKTAPGVCCGLCVKTKCLYLNQMYSVGDTWHSEDRCMLFECMLESDTPVISTFKKSCPELADCKIEDTYTEDCCQYCRNDSKSRMPSDPASTGHAPCKRTCKANDKPMTCRYEFRVEWSETLSRACYNCPFNKSDCYRPECISGDGIRKSVITANRMMPGPIIEVCLNDRIVVDVTNGMFSDATTIHWHGMHQKFSPFMDGVPYISQCPILPHMSFRYDFQAENAGTHFWHSHVGLQRGDGLAGPFIVREPNDQHAKLFDYDLTEHIIMLQDWIHTNGMTMFTNHHLSIGENKPMNILVNGRGRFLSKTEVTSDPIDDNTEEAKAETPVYDNNEIPPPIVHNMKMSDVMIENNLTLSDRLANVPIEIFHVKKGFRYRFRTINSGFLNCPITISVDNHTLLVIQSDGYDMEPIEVTSLISYAGERFDFVLNANQSVGNYWMRFKGLMDCDERFNKAHQVAVVRYDGAPEQEPTAPIVYDYPIEGLQLNPLNKGSGDESTRTIAEVNSISSYKGDAELQKEEADYKFYVYFDFYGTNNSMFFNPPLYSFQTGHKKIYTPQFNHISLNMPTFPIAAQPFEAEKLEFCNETSLEDKGIDCRDEFCKCLHALQVPLNSIVEMVLVDEGKTFAANHPFHLHGYGFRVLGMGRVGSETTVETIKEMDRSGEIKRNLKNPPIKDTITVPDGGYTIIRFQASNPGYWLFHCHIDFHAEIGMALVLKVGEAKDVYKAPADFPQCSNYMPKADQNDLSINNSVGRTIAVTLLSLLFVSFTVIYL